MNSKFKDRFEDPIGIDDNKPDMGRCEECHEELELSRCIRDYGHHDGWEMPAYTELLCPLCEDGFIAGDVWFSDEKN